MTSSRVVVAALGLILLVGVIAYRATGRPSSAARDGAGTSTPSAGMSAPSLGPGQTRPGTNLASPGTAILPPAASAKASCRPTDQDRYVYSPDRLSVQMACVRVTGVVDAVVKKPDGDLHFLVHLDPAYSYLLTPANQGAPVPGDLVVEAVCVGTTNRLAPEAACTSDPDPLHPPFPVVGERVWMEGQYVFDLEHAGWAELHPLFRWGP